MAYASKIKRKPAPARKGKAAAPSKASRWVQQIERYERGSLKWREQADKIGRIYLDQHRDEKSADRHFALLWANVETMKPATYARKPQAVVTRRWEVDPAGRKASEVLERCLNVTFDLYGIHQVMESVRDDRLLAARGTAWVRYEVELEDIAGAQPGADGKLPQRKASEKVCNEFVHWSDFGHSLARTWPEVTAVWRRVYMTREAVRDRAFANAEAVKALRYEVRPEAAEKYGGDDAYEPQCVIYEIWDKATAQTLWLARDQEVILEEGEPPIEFRDFWPCPPPSYGTKATRSLIPTPDYRYYQDQAEEIDDLTAKISGLTSWLRLKGFIPSGPSSEGGDAITHVFKLEQDLRSKGDSILVPIESWTGFTEKGGATKLIDWIPLDIVVAALREAITARRELKNDVFELTGISDILRGESDPNETLGAQQLKAQTGTRRISTVQRDLARFARDLAELDGEVIAQLFSPETMSDMSGLDLTTAPPPELLAQQALLKQQLAAAQQQPPMPGAMDPNQPGAMPGAPVPPPAAPPQPDPKVVEQLQAIEEQLKAIELNKQVIELLQDERTLGFRIEIETDSTIEPDEQAEKQRRVEFLDAVGNFMKNAMPVLQMQPQLAPVMKEMLLFLVRGFRAGRGLEDVIERSMTQIEQTAAQPKQPPVDPRLAKVQSDAALGAAELKQEGQLELRRQDQDAALVTREQNLRAAASHQDRQVAALEAVPLLAPAPGPGGQTL